MAGKMGASIGMNKFHQEGGLTAWLAVGQKGGDARHGRRAQTRKDEAMKAKPKYRTVWINLEKGVARRYGKIASLIGVSLPELIAACITVAVAQAVARKTA